MTVIMNDQAGIPKPGQALSSLGENALTCVTSKRRKPLMGKKKNEERATEKGAGLKQPFLLAQKALAESRKTFQTAKRL